MPATPTPPGNDPFGNPDAPDPDDVVRIDSSKGKAVDPPEPKKPEAKQQAPKKPAPEPDDYHPARIEDDGTFPLEKLTSPRSRQQRGVVSLHEQAGRVPPQATDVEQSVLGAMLIEKTVVPRIAGLLTPGEFYDTRHNRIFAAMLALYDRSEPIDFITLTDELKRRDQYEPIGGYYLSELTTRVASAANAEYHAHIVKEQALKRGIIEQLTVLVGDSYDTTTDAFELLDRVEQAGRDLGQGFAPNKGRLVGDIGGSVLERLATIESMPGGITGVPSGFHALDALTGGWQKQDLIILAARPSMGKTALALAFAENAALHASDDLRTAVGVFSLEMGENPLVQRMLTGMGRVDAQRARLGKLRGDDWPRLHRAQDRLSHARIFIDQRPSLDVRDFRSAARRLVDDEGVGLLIVDYLQLMEASAMARHASREREIAYISATIKAVAKELDVPAIALAQLSRAVETRGGDKRPMLSDLRESGAIEQDADIVAFVYRPEYYAKKGDAAPFDVEVGTTDGKGEIIIGKHRSGPTGNVWLAFVKEYARWENLSTTQVHGDGAPSAPPSSSALPTHSVSANGDDPNCPF